MTQAFDLAAAPFLLDDVEIDPQAREARRAGRVLDVRDLSFDLLIALARAWPDPVDSAAMAAHVWNAAHVSEDAIAKRVALLRKGLEDDARQPRYVRTVRHRGYALMPQPRTLRTETAMARKPALLRHRLGIAAGLMVGTALLAVIVVTRPWQSAESGPGTVSVVSADYDQSIRLDRARSLLEQHRPAQTEAAIALLEAALADRPMDVQTRLGLSFALTTRVTKFEGRANDIDRAEALARALIDEDAGGGRAWHALAYALDARGLLDESLAAYQQAYTLDPDDVAAMSSAAYLLGVRGRLHDALRLEARALELGRPTLYGPLQIASSLSLLDHPAAAVWWQRAMAGDAGETVTLAEQIEADLRGGDAIGALDRIDAATADIQSSPRLKRLAGQAHLRSGNIEAAALALSEAGEQAVLEQFALAAMRGETVDPGLYESEISSALANGESWPDLRIRIAAIHARTGELEQAAGLVGQAIDLGWRDAGWIETSPFFTPLVTSDLWPPLRDRIDRELAAQSRLIESDPALLRLLDTTD